jgi:PAS domain S-box-containing protein
LISSAEEEAGKPSFHHKTPSKGRSMPQLEPNTSYPLALLDSISEAVFVIDTRWCYTYVNKKAEELVGKPREALLGNSIWDLFPQTVNTLFSTEMHRAVQEHTSTHVEAYYPPLQKWFESRIYPSADGLLIFSQDITRRKQAEEALQRSEELLHTLADTAPSIIWIAEPDGTITFHNKQWIEYTGISPQENATSWPELVLHPDDIDRCMKAWQYALQHGTNYEIEVRNRRHDGVYRWFITRAVPVRDASGHITAWFGSTTDIHERKLMEEELGKYAALISSSDDAIVTKTLDGTITSWNNAAERMFGYTAEEAIGQPITLIIPPELYQEEEDIIRKLRQGIRIQHYETVRMRKDGTKVDVSLSISPVKDSAGNILGAAKIARDITERLELERRKDEFISMASHELKTPITTLKGWTQLVMRRFERKGLAEELPMLRKMDEQFNRLGRLINELLDASKIQAGRLDYEEEPVDIDALVQETVELLQPICPTHTLTVRGATHAVVRGDKDRLEQVLTNLITNAVKYSPCANSVDITLSASYKTATISVRDYGVGIPNAHQKNIFDRFYRVYGEHDKTFRGLGMGLYIAHEIVKRHGGKLTVESEEGKGSTFMVSLPLENK